MASYAKLFSSILDSSIWCESLPVKVLWISMLARADRGGIVIASVPGLAKLAGISTKECRDGLERLSSPDPESGTKDFGGRRIMEVDRGWVILNYVKFRDMKSDEEIREKVRVRVHNFREKHKADVTDVTLGNALYPPVTESNDIAEADTDTTTESFKKEQSALQPPKSAEPTMGCEEIKAPKVPKRPSWKIAHPQEVIKASLAVRSLWPDPTHGDLQPDRKTPVPGVSLPKLATALKAILDQGGEMEVCLELAKWAIEDYKTKGTWIKAPQFFFGPAKDAPWRDYYQAHVTNQQIAEASNG